MIVNLIAALIAIVVVTPFAIAGFAVIFDGFEREELALEVLTDELER